MLTDARSIPLGRVLGIPVRASWSVVAVSIVGSWLVATRILPTIDENLSMRLRLVLAALGVAFFLGSILAHEFGHALVARRHGIGTSSIRLWIFGGVAALSGPARTPRAEFQIAVAGPAVNTVIAAGLVGAAWIGRRLGAPDILLIIAGGLAVLNILLTVTNLVPAAPLDGGRVLSSILWARTGRQEWARLISARVGLLTGAAIVLYGLNEALLRGRPAGLYTAAIGAFIVVAARADVITASIRGRLGRTTVAEVLHPYPSPISDSLTLTDMERHVGTESRSVPVQRWANQTIGYVTTDSIASVPVAERSWTSVSDLMVPTEYVPTAWTSESLLVVLERHGGDPSQMLGVDPASGLVVGTATAGSFRHLLARPLIWGGVDLDPETPPVAPSVPVTSPS